ncbi:MAG: ABC transporter substrate-binding protein [Spirochaetes bacterium]|nr:ABC transporter substrate-binding protein [Spirochaetota bacterium]
MNKIEKIFPLIVITAVSAVLLFYARSKYVLSDKIPVISADARIVSLSPSITREILLLDMEPNLAGVTSFCPPLKRDVPKVGNLLNPNIEKIAAINPDILFFSEEDNPSMKFEGLLQSRIPLYKFRRNRTFEDIISNFIILAKITGKHETAGKLLEQIRDDRLKILENRKKEKTGAFFLSSRPLISVSRESYINNILADAGIRNIIADFSNPYPIISVEFLLGSKPEIIFSTDPEADDFFTEIYKKADLKKPEVIIMSPDNVCYYTPSDYIESLKFFYGTVNEKE